MGCKCINPGNEDEIKARDQKGENTSFIEEENNNQNSPYINNSNKIINKNNDNTRTNNNIIYSENIINSENKNTQFNSNNENIELNEKENQNVTLSNYSEKLVEFINIIRQDPSSYADFIEDSIKNIVENNNKDDNNKTKIIYKQKIKVALTRGEPAFHEAAEELRRTKPLPPLEFVSKMCIPLPDSKEEIKGYNFLKNQVIELRDKGVSINVFFKDLVKIPEVSVLLMIVDDCSKNPGKKRMTELTKDFRYIGVNSKFIGKTFIAYLAFSK